MEEGTRNSIKTLTRIFYDYQRERMSLDGRLGITKAGDIKKKAPERDMEILAFKKLFQQIQLMPILFIIAEYSKMSFSA